MDDLMITTHARTFALTLAATAVIGLVGFLRPEGPTGPQEKTAATKGDASAPKSEPLPAGIGHWSEYRGDGANTGLSHSDVPDWNKVGIKWRYWTGSYQSSTPAVADGKVIVCTEDGDMHCVDAKTGKGLWKAWVSTGRGPGKGVVRSSPLILDGMAYIGNRIGQVWAVDMSNGERKWHWQAKTPQPQVYSSPKGDERGVVFGVVDMKLAKGKVVCLDPKTGKEKWSIDTGREVGATPAIFGDTVYIACKDRRLYEIDYETGKVSRTMPLPGTTHCTLTIGMGFGYLVTGGQHVLAMDLLSGKTAWDVSESVDDQCSVGFANGKAYFPVGRSMAAFDGVSGKKVWEVQGGHKFAPPCIAKNGDVLTINRDGRFRVIRDGKVLKEVDLGEPCVAGAILVDKWVYTCSDVNSGHHLFALAEME